MGKIAAHWPGEVLFGMDLRKINDRVSVSGQIDAADLAPIREAGFVAVVNNRPDAEAPDQPTSAEIEAAARAAGLAYHTIPVGRDGVSEEMIEATRRVLAEAGGPVLCYCRSGTRSTTLWALSQAGSLSADAIISAAAEAGYDLNHLSAHLAQPMS